MSETKEAFKRSLKGALTHAKRVLKTNNELRRGLVGTAVGATAGGASSYAGVRSIRKSEHFKKMPEAKKKKVIKNQRRGVLSSAVGGGILGHAIGSFSGMDKDFARKGLKIRRKWKADDFRYEKTRAENSAKWKADKEKSDKHWEDFKNRWQDFGKEWADTERKYREARQNYQNQRGSSNAGGYAPPPKPPQNIKTPDWLKDVKTKVDAKKKYREQAAKHHPDRGGNTKDMQDINNAWEAFKKSSDFNKLGMRLPSFFQELLQISNLS